MTPTRLAAAEGGTLHQSDHLLSVSPDPLYCHGHASEWVDKLVDMTAAQYRQAIVEPKTYFADTVAQSAGGHEQSLAANPLG